MKRLVQTLLGIMFGWTLLFATGCATKNPDGTSTPYITPARVESVARLSAYTTAKLLLSKDPKSIETLTKVSAGLNELVAANKWDLATAVAIANANGLNALVSSEGQLALAVAPQFIDLIAGQTVSLDQQEYAKAAITGAANGFKMALPSTAPAARATSGIAPATEMRRLQAEAAATLKR